MDFAVYVEGEDGLDKEGKQTGRWVLAVDGKRILLNHPDGTLHWYELGECKFLTAWPPHHPKPVIPVQPGPQQQAITVPHIVMPGEFGQMRRDGQN